MPHNQLSNFVCVHSPDRQRFDSPYPINVKGGGQTFQVRFHCAGVSSTTVSGHVKGIPQGKQPRGTWSRQESGEEDSAVGPWPVGEQVGVFTGCGRDPGWTGKSLAVSLFVLQKWRR